MASCISPCPITSGPSMRAMDASCGATNGKPRAASTSVTQAGIREHWLFFETPDNHLVSLDARNGKFRWSVEIADLSQEMPTPWRRSSSAITSSSVSAAIPSTSPDTSRLAIRKPAPCNGTGRRRPARESPALETRVDQYSTGNTGMAWTMPGTRPIRS